MRWRARAAASDVVAIEYAVCGSDWMLARVLTAFEADELGAALRAAAQESRRMTRSLSWRCHGGDCDDFPRCECGAGGEPHHDRAQ